MSLLSLPILLYYVASSIYTGHRNESHEVPIQISPSHFQWSVHIPILMSTLVAIIFIQILAVTGFLSYKHFGLVNIGQVKQNRTTDIERKGYNVTPTTHAVAFRVSCTVTVKPFVYRPTNAQGNSGFLLTRSKFFYPDMFRHMVAILRGS
jgi:hypothetical protein